MEDKNSKGDGEKLGTHTSEPSNGRLYAVFHFISIITLIKPFLVLLNKILNRYKYVRTILHTLSILYYIIREFTFK